MKGDQIRAAAFLEGKNIVLRGLLDSDADGPYVSWFNSREACRGNSHHRHPFSRELALAYIRRTREDPSTLVLAIAARAGGRHVGNVALQSIHPLYQSAELSIIIGAAADWGKGYAAEACRLICAHAFDALNLRRISCGTFADNTGMQRVAESIGMTREGLRREAAFKAGRFVDVVEYGMLRAEFVAGDR